MAARHCDHCHLWTGARMKAAEKRGRRRSDLRLIFSRWSLWIVVFATHASMLVRQGNIDTHQKQLRYDACERSNLLRANQTLILHTLIDRASAISHASGISQADQRKAVRTLSQLRDALALLPHPRVDC